MPCLDVPAEQAAEIVEHVNGEGESEAVEIRAALDRREHRDDGDRDLERDGGDEQVMAKAPRRASAW